MSASTVDLAKYQQQLSDLQTQLAAIELRQNLVAELLSATSSHQGVADYFSLLNREFLEFANQESSLEDEAAALLTLQEIGNELKVVSTYPDFHKKRTIAIAGGFSAGKSEFISSLFSDSSVRLPIGIEPTTAIPTYALNGESNSLLGCSLHGGIVDLLAIDADFQHKLSHHFIRSFGFNLKTIMPFVFLSTPMPFQHLCFIDTPGYNPSDMTEGHTAEDSKTAEEFIHNADALLWLIGVDVNGTIAKSDLEFLEKVSNNIEKPLYIILNKADLRPYEQIEEVVDEVAETLEDYGIEVAGISAYSAIFKKEFTYRYQSLHDFLNEMDIPSDKHSAILQRLQEVDNKYQYAILRDLKENTRVASALNSLKLDLLEEGWDDTGSEIYEKISRIIGVFTLQQHQLQLQQLAAIIEKMVAAVDAVFGEQSSWQRHILTLEDIELSKKYEQLLQNKQEEEKILDMKSLFWKNKSQKGLSQRMIQAIDSLLLENKRLFSVREYAEKAGVEVYDWESNNDEIHKEISFLENRKFCIIRKKHAFWNFSDEFDLDSKCIFTMPKNKQENLWADFVVRHSDILVSDIYVKHKTVYNAMYLLFRNNKLCFEQSDWEQAYCDCGGKTYKANKRLEKIVGWHIAEKDPNGHYYFILDK